MMFLFSACLGQQIDFKVRDGRFNQLKTKVENNIHDLKSIRKENKVLFKTRRKEYQILVDSLENPGPFSELLSKDSLSNLMKIQEEHFIYLNSFYPSVEISKWTPTTLRDKDQILKSSIDFFESKREISQLKEIKNQILGIKRKLNVYKDSLEAVGSLSKEEMDFLIKKKSDELTFQKEKDLESFAKDYLTREIGDLPKGFENKEFAQFTKQHNYLSKGINGDGLMKLSKSQAIDHFKNNQKIIEDAQKRTKELKGIYSEVSELNNLSTAKKKKSLENVPTKQRFVFGGMFQFHFDKITQIDLNPELNYRLSRNFEFGFGGTYKLKLESKEMIHSLNVPDVFGGRLLIEHRLYNNYFFHFEYEALNCTIPELNGRMGNDWFYSLLAGLERRINLKGKVQGQAQLLYNFNYKNNPTYKSPLTFRLGFNLSRKDY